MVFLYILLAMILAIILLLILVLFTQAKLFLLFTFDGNTYHVKIRLKALFGLVKYTMEIPENLDQKAEEKSEEKRPSHPLESKQSADMDQVPSQSSNQPESKKDISFKKGITAKKTKENPDQPSDQQLSKDEALAPLENIKLYFDQVSQYFGIIKAFMKKIKIKTFIWKTVIGTGDAALTGMTSGAGWAIKGQVLGVIRHFMNISNKPVIAIEPDFQKAIVKTSLECMFQVRIGNAALAGIKLFFNWRRMKKKSSGKLKKENDQTL